MFLSLYLCRSRPYRPVRARSARRPGTAASRTACAQTTAVPTPSSSTAGTSPRERRNASTCEAGGSPRAEVSGRARRRQRPHDSRAARGGVV